MDGQDVRSVSELMSLDGRVALVTGGAGHIGGAIGEALAEVNADVAIADTSSTAYAGRVEQLAAIGSGRAEGFEVNLGDEAETRALIHRVVRRLGRLDVLFHSAAFVGTTELAGWAVPFEEQSVEAWDAAMRINVTAAFVLVQEASEVLARSRNGSVVLISSTYGMVGPDFSLYEGTSMANPAAYNASKGGIIQLTRYLATLLAPRIRVNALSPGGVWRNQPGVFRDRYVAKTPLSRMATEEDIKGAAVYLASDLSAYVTGHNLVVDGGWTAW